MKNTSRKHYIYKVTNFVTGQYYIGSQCSGKIVGMNYFTSSTNKEFKEGFKTYREEKYKIEIIKEFEEFEDPEKCVRAENYMISDHMQLKDGLCLNRACCCSGEKIFSTVGMHPSEETRKKLSEANKGQSPSKETRKKMSEAHKGTHHSEEAKQKMSEAKKGRQAWNKGIPSPNKGIPLSEETKQKMSEAHKGIPSPQRIKISIEGEVFSSITEASKYYNVSDTTISRWAKKNQHNTFYIEK